MTAGTVSRARRDDLRHNEPVSAQIELSLSLLVPLCNSLHLTGAPLPLGRCSATVRGVHP